MTIARIALLLLLACNAAAAQPFDYDAYHPAAVAQIVAALPRTPQTGWRKAKRVFAPRSRLRQLPADGEGAPIGRPCGG
jgi:hypothetical protein